MNKGLVVLLVGLIVLTLGVLMLLRPLAVDESARVHLSLFIAAVMWAVVLRLKAWWSRLVGKKRQWQQLGFLPMVFVLTLVINSTITLGLLSAPRLVISAQELVVLWFLVVLISMPISWLMWRI